MKKKILSFIYIFSLIVFLEPQIFKENSFVNVGYFDLVYKIIKIIVFIFIFCIYIKRRKISLLIVLATVLEGLIGFSTIINGGDIVRYTGPAITVVAMAMLAELMYNDDSFVNQLNKINIYLRITFIINIVSIVLIDYMGFDYITKVYLWGIDNRFVFTMIPWIFFEGLVSIKKKQKLDYKWLLVVLVCEAVLLIKKSVAAMLLMPLFILAYFIQKEKKFGHKDSIIIFIVYVISNIGILFTDITKIIGPLTRLVGKDPTLSGRTFIWSGVMKLLQHKPLLGGGTQSIGIDKNYFYLSSEPYYLPWCKVQHAHNSIMNTLYRGGIISTSVYTFILLLVSLYIDKIENKSMKVLSAITFGIILFLSLFDTIDFACLYYIFAIVICSSSYKIMDNKVIIVIGKAIKSAYRYIMVFIFNLFPIKKNKIFISNYNGKGYGDSAKPIVEELNKQNKKYKIYWLVNNINFIDETEFPSNVIPVQKDSISYFYHVCTARVWIDNRRPIIELNKRKNQFYIQLWHSGISMKKVEKDAKQALNKRYVRAAKKDSTKIDIMISNSSFCTNLFKNAFWYNGEIKEFGLPRNDILMNDSLHATISKKVKEYYNIKENEKILLYAPTFRKNYSVDPYDIDFERLENELKDRFNCDWKILVKLHPNMDVNAANTLTDGKITINATDYSDMQELMIAADILISDYSSVMFEFSFMKKPVFLYTKDIEEYNNDRGFYFDLYKLPYQVCKNNKELLNNIREYNNTEYLEKLKNFFDSIGLKETGHAAKKVVEEIVRVLDNE